jgi:hypothetical protein
VQVVGHAAVLTFNYVSWGNEGEARWNCTEVYRHDPVGWRIVQTHWSYTDAGTPARANDRGPQSQAIPVDR